MATQPDFPQSQLRIPPELFIAVVEVTDNTETLLLCRVSRQLGLEAERILYREVRLENATGERLLKFCHAVICSFHRAASVKKIHLPGQFGVPDNGHSTLSSPRQRHDAFSRAFQSMVEKIHLPGHFGVPDNGHSTLSSPRQLHDAFSRAFQSMVNLKELSFQGEPDNTCVHPTILPATFENCRFSLTDLSGRMPAFTPQDVWNTLRLHPTIRYWVPDLPLLNSITSIPQGILPSLSQVVLVSPKILGYLDGCPLSRLVLVFVDPIYETGSAMLAVMQVLQRFQRTLTHLVLHFMHTRSLTWGDLIRETARNAPRLKSLSVSYHKPLIFEDEQVHRDVSDAMSMFQEIEVVELIAGTESDLPEPDNALTHYEFLAEKLMISCASLEKVALGDGYIGISTTSPDGRPTYLRSHSATGRAQAVFWGFNMIDTSLWWMK